VKKEKKEKSSSEIEDGEEDELTEELQRQVPGRENRLRKEEEAPSYEVQVHHPGKVYMRMFTALHDFDFLKDSIQGALHRGTVSRTLEARKTNRNPVSLTAESFESVKGWIIEANKKNHKLVDIVVNKEEKSKEGAAGVVDHTEDLVKQLKESRPDLNDLQLRAWARAIDTGSATAAAPPETPLCPKETQARRKQQQLLRVDPVPVGEAGSRGEESEGRQGAREGGEEGERNWTGKTESETESETGSEPGSETGRRRERGRGRERERENVEGKIFFFPPFSSLSLTSQLLL